MSELGVNNVGIQQNYSASESKPQNDAQTQQKNSIFGDYNNNGTVDKSDFKDAALAQMAEEKGLIGKAWDAVHDILKNITSGKQTYMTQISKDDRQGVLDAFKKNGIEFKANPDGSIEYTMEGIKNICSWNGDVSRITTLCSNGNTILSDYNLATNEGIDTVTNPDGTFKHEVKCDKDGNIVSVKNYEKNENGELVESNKFVGVNLSTGDMYTGSDLAKIFARQNYEFSIDFNTFIRSICRDVEDIHGARSGPYNIKMKDGTEITYDYDYTMAIAGIQEPKLIISKNGEVLETYNKKGEAIKE